VVILSKKWSCTYLFAGIRQCSPANGNARFSRIRHSRWRKNYMEKFSWNTSFLKGPIFPVNENQTSIAQLQSRETYPIKRKRPLGQYPGGRKTLYRYMLYFPLAISAWTSFTNSTVTFDSSAISEFENLFEDKRFSITSAFALASP